MRIIKPKRLKHGDVIGICAPASPPPSEEKLHRGVQYLERIGFRVKLGKHILKKYGYLAGSDQQRASDLNDFFSDSKIKAIFTARGGYGSHRILPLLNYDVIKLNPKVLVGYSDITALHLSLLSKAGLVTFSGPMAAVEMSSGLSGKAEELFWDMLMSTDPPPPMKGGSTTSDIFHRKGIAVGRLIGGNLSLVTALIGTPYFPLIKNPILILEEIDERPYRIDRLLQQMKLSGILHKARGIALGNFISCMPEKGKPSLTLREIFKDALREYKNPVVSGFQYGHQKSSTCFPIGTRVRLDAQNDNIEFLDSGVS